MSVQYTVAISKIKEWVDKMGMKTGDTIPSARALSSLLSLSHSNTNRACLMLIGEGYLRREGYKLFLAQDPPVKTAKHAPVWVVSSLDYFNQCVMEIIRGAGVPCTSHPLGYHSPEADVIALKEVSIHECSGIIIAPTGWNPRIEQQICTMLKVPVIVCTSMIGKGEFNYITTDHQAGVRKAIEHLHALGHRELAFVTEYPATKFKTIHSGDTSSVCYDWNIALMNEYSKACDSLGMVASRARIWEMDSLGGAPSPNVVAQFKAYLDQNPEVTAVFSDDRGALTALHATNVPDNLSVVGYFSGDEGKYASPPLTSVGDYDPHFQPRMAAGEMLAMIKNPIKLTNNPLYIQVHITPQLIRRKSTRPLSTISVHEQKSSPVIKDDDATNPWVSWLNSYPSLQKEANQVWTQMDLRKAANRQMSHQNGWPAADPLFYFDGGMQWIHGVPFAVMSKAENQGRDIIVMASKHAHVANGEPLQSEIGFPFYQSVNALYFLHACTRAYPEPFAHYEIEFTTGDLVKIPLIPLGRGLMSNSANTQANIQDWWHSFEQIKATHAHHLMVTDPKNPGSYSRYLYTLEWINPSPSTPIKTVRIVSNPEAETTLIVFAITACS